MRLAGLSVSVLAALRMPTTAARVDALVERQGRLEADAQALCDALYEVIGQLPDVSLRPRLVGLRRAIHQGRRPAPQEWNTQLATALPAAVSAQVEQWLQRMAEHRRDVDALPELFTTESARLLPALRAAAGEPLFRRALSQASPSLSQELDKWLADGQRRPGAKMLDRLVKYLSRAAAKTSPYSTFMLGGYGTWSGEGPAIRFSSLDSLQTVLEPDRLLIAGAARVLLRRPRLAATVPLRLNPGRVDTGEHITFPGPLPSEPIITVSATPALRACLRAVEREPSLTHAALTAELAAAAGEDLATARRFVDRLLQTGLLEPRLPITDQSDDPLGELVGWLEAAPADTAAEGEAPLAPLADAARRLRTELRRQVPMADLAGHRERLRSIEQEATRLTTQLGIRSTATASRQLPIALAHESAVLTSQAAWCAREPWQSAVDTLDVLRRWLPVHDPTLPMRVVLGAYVRERMGAGARVPFLTLHHALQRELASGAAAPSGGVGAELRRWFDVVRAFPASWLADSPLPRLRELHRLRLEALRPLEAPPEADGVVRVEPEALARTSEARPSWARAATPGSVAYFLQPFALDSGRVRVALNSVTAGHGRGRSRLRHLVTAAGGAPSWSEEPGCPHAPLIAELAGTFGTALNTRTPAAPYEIDYPASASQRPEDERLALGELVAVHEPDTDLVRLESTRLGRPVRVLHLGVMFEGLLPPAARLLVRMSGFTALPPGWADTELPLLPVAPDEVLAIPRVEVGPVVLRRARWVTAAAAIPARPPGESDAHYLLRLAHWRRRHHLPSRCFVRLTDSSRAAAMVFDKSRKPVYVDWASGPLVSTFERLVRERRGEVVLEEPLPVPEDAAGPEGRVTELLIELQGCECHDG